MTLTLNDYQELSARTTPVGTHKGLTNYALGLVAEGGEAADHIKKHVFHGHALDEDGILKELGDTLHYLSGLTTMLGYTLEEVATMNLEKLKKRYPKGFSQEASINRND